MCVCVFSRFRTRSSQTSHSIPVPVPAPCERVCKRAEDGVCCVPLSSHALSSVAAAAAVQVLLPLLLSLLQPSSVTIRYFAPVASTTAVCLCHLFLSCVSAFIGEHSVFSSCCCSLWTCLRIRVHLMCLLPVVSGTRS
jgi:hypothetical protein